MQLNSLNIQSFTGITNSPNKVAQKATAFLQNGIEQDEFMKIIPREADEIIVKTPKGPVKITCLEDVMTKLLGVKFDDTLK